MGEYLNHYDTGKMSWTEQRRIAEDDFSLYGIFPHSKEKVYCEVPTKIMLDCYKNLDDEDEKDELEDWIEEVKRMNGTEQTIINLDLNQSGFPVAIVSGSDFYVPLDCFEKYNNSSSILEESCCDGIDFY